MAEFFSTSFGAQGADETEQHLRDQFGAGLSLTGSGTRYSDSTVGDADFSLTRMHFDGGFSCTWEPQVVTVALSTSRYRWDADGGRGSGADGPMLFQPGAPMFAHTENSSAIAVNLDPERLEHTARAVYADDDLRVRFDSVQPASSRLGEAWVATARAAVESLPLLDNALLRSSLSRTLAVVTLECFQLSGDRKQRNTSFEAQRIAYRRATQFLDDYASLPVTIDDAAWAAGIPTSDLIRAFRANSPLGFTPTQYLRRARLAAAHVDLVNADPTRGATVGEIAARWGFGSPSNFARRYREVYRVNPKWVLDR